MPVLFIEVSSFRGGGGVLIRGVPCGVLISGGPD